VRDACVFVRNFGAEKQKIFEEQRLKEQQMKEEFSKLK